MDQDLKGEESSPTSAKERTGKRSSMPDLLPKITADVLQAYMTTKENVTPCLEASEAEGLQKGLEPLLCSI